MVRVIVHAGLTKTGSKSVQHGFDAQRAHLATHGFFYPLLAEGYFPAHWALGAFWRERMVPESAGHLIERLDPWGPPEAQRRHVLGRLAATMAEARRWEAKAGAEAVVILSDEQLGYPGAAVAGARLLAFCARQGAGCEVLAYARPDPDLFLSLVQQQCKSFERPFSYLHLRHAPQVAVLRRGWGEARVHVRVFAREALEGGETITDLCAWIHRITGRKPPDLPPLPRRNESVPAAGCALALRAIAAQKEAQFEPLCRAMMLSRKEIGAPLLTLPPGWEDRILGEGHGAWNALVATTDHPQDLRARLRLKPRPRTAAITPDEIRPWLEAQRDPAYEAALVVWLRAKAERWMPPVAEMVARLA